MTRREAFAETKRNFRDLEPASLNVAHSMTRKRLIRGKRRKEAFVTLACDKGALVLYTKSDLLLAKGMIDSCLNYLGVRTS